MNIWCVATYNLDDLWHLTPNNMRLERKEWSYLWFAGKRVSLGP